MNDRATDITERLPELGQLVEGRLALARALAESLEISTVSLAQNDAQAIARGAAHQAELCRQWSCLEEELRRRAAMQPSSMSIPGSVDFQADSARLQAEWETLSDRIRHLTRVHCSLLRHLHRSLAILTRVVDSCASTYTLDPGLLGPETAPLGRLKCRD